ncbi:MAG: PadR family transcriptional regulator, partial [Desulfovibrionales bacterium]|nr:PadR family transcriptional regulator [Desulfovibrionales bacterium]
IKKALEQKVSPFYSSSLGSIQPALKKLLEQGFITLEKQIHNKRIRNLYIITDDGRAYFRKAMLEEIPEKKAETDIFIRLFFLGVLDSEDRLQCLKMMSKVCDAMATEYTQYEELLKEDLPGELKPLQYYSIKTLDIAIKQFRITNLELNALLAEA